jgi:predicted helicase
MKRMIDFFNTQREAYHEASKRADGKKPDVESFIDRDERKIHWTREIKEDVESNRAGPFRSGAVRKALYRPFHKSWMYFDGQFNNCVYQMPKLYPSAETSNLVIQATGVGANKEFSAIITDALIDYEAISKGQAFPLYYFEKGGQKDLLQKTDSSGWVCRDAISDNVLRLFSARYAKQSGKKICKEDLFYYVYGILHSPEYRQRFEADLRKQLPRLPFAGDFWAFSKAGRELAKWHLNYETVDPYPLKHIGELALGDPKLYRVQKMAWSKQRVAGKLTEDKTTLIYNSRITFTGIPPEALEYVVNGKPAIEWVMERYQITTDKDSGIVNDPNDWAAEHDDPTYIFDLVRRVVRVSVETVKIVKSLPPLNIASGP